ncbi:MAG TPA: AbrB/MazE/SpoVT family DNA-binding domain-containing protein [bacterium]|jgi:hypothetical protein|nr:AbrB/MazE/SpoVT family DNA-binding domain-containing protein [bacterium]
MPRLAKLSSKNQLTLPKAVLKNYPDVEYFDVNISVAEGGILLKPVRPETQSSPLEAMRTHFKRLGITEKDIRDAVQWARRNKGPR